MNKMICHTKVIIFDSLNCMLIEPRIHKIVNNDGGTLYSSL